MENEIWKDIHGYEGHYQISYFGNIKSIKFKVKKILKPRISKQGYYYINLCKYGKVRSVFVHKLMAFTYLDHKSCNHEIIVDHIDNNKLNNMRCNLQLISQRENSSKDQFRRNKTSKYTGVCWAKGQNKWKSAIRINGHRLHLGYFINEIDAHITYKNKLNELV